jgi:hypothetical protein
MARYNVGDKVWLKEVGDKPRVRAYVAMLLDITDPSNPYWNEKAGPQQIYAGANLDANTSTEVYTEFTEDETEGLVWETQTVWFTSIRRKGETAMSATTNFFGSSKEAVDTALHEWVEETMMMETDHQDGGYTETQWEDLVSDYMNEKFEFTDVVEYRVTD